MAGRPCPGPTARPTQPLYLRTGRSTDLRAGGATGRVGAFGSEVFAVPPDAAQALLRLPQPADAHAAGVRRGGGKRRGDDRAHAAPARRAARPAGATRQERSVVLRAAPGQASRCAPSPPGRTCPTARAATGSRRRPTRSAATRRRRRRRCSASPRTAPATAIGSAGVPEIGAGAGLAHALQPTRRNDAAVPRRPHALTVAVRAEGPAVTARITTLGRRGDERDRQRHARATRGRCRPAGTRCA